MSTKIVADSDTVPCHCDHTNNTVERLLQAITAAAADRDNMSNLERLRWSETVVLAERLTCELSRGAP
jgi:hypothetical protein